MITLACPAPNSSPAVAQIAIAACDEALGSQLALTLADLGAAVLLQGTERIALERLQRAIAERWGRAVIQADASGSDAAISIAADTTAAIGSIERVDAPAAATTILLVQSGNADGHAALQAALTRAEPIRVIHAISLPAGAAAGGIDYPALARICALLASDAGRAMTNQHITLHTHAAGDGANAASYPDMPVCAPTIVPLG
ncbi:MAG: hypothetical protein RL671_138 [Pseudomonadota bacterium]